MLQNFYPDVTTVRINGSDCANVTVAESCASLSCVAPVGAGVTFMVVTVAELQGTTTFAYDPPVVTHLSESPVDAASVVSIDVFGTNLGFPEVKYRGTTTIVIGAALVAIAMLARLLVPACV